MIGANVTRVRTLVRDRLDLDAAGRQWTRSRGWWVERSLREQVLLGVLAATAIFTVLLLMVIVPLRAVREAAHDDLHMTALVEARLRAGGTRPGQSAPMRQGNPSAILTDSAAAARLSIERMEPEGGNTRITLGDASFDQVMRWIADVEQTSRLRVAQAQIDRKGAPGMVHATFVMSN